MPRSFIGKVSRLAIVIGSLFIIVLAAFGYSLATAIHADDEALTTYAEELILGETLEADVQLKMASGRGYLLAHRPEDRTAFEEASLDARERIASLRARVKSKEGTRL